MAPQSWTGASHPSERVPTCAPVNHLNVVSLPHVTPEFADVAAIDVETATSERRSICQVAVALVDANGGLEARSWLVRPPRNRYDRENIDIHGIRPEDTEDSPEFETVLPDLLGLIGNRLLIAHNAEFDGDCLAQAADTRHANWPALFDMGCTLRIAHLLLPDRTAPYKLPNLCADFGVPFVEEHDAASDATAAMRLAMELFRRAPDENFAALVSRANTGWRVRSEAAMRRVWGSAPATDKQIAFLHDLGAPFNEHTITKGEASQLIDEWKSRRPPRRSRSRWSQAD